MPNLEDEQFEIYLRKFRPLEAAPLPVKTPVRPRRHWLRLAAPASFAAAALVLGIVMLHLRADHVRSTHGHGNPSMEEGQVNSRPLTLGVASRLLANAPSLGSALDSIGAESLTPAIPKGEKSALGVLGEEEIRP